MTTFTGTSGDDIFNNPYANGGNDTFFGGKGDDFIRAGYGDDVIKGGGGADTIMGDAGTDTASYADSTEGVIVSLETNSGVGGTAEGDRIYRVENLIGSAYADWLFGEDHVDNVLTGLGGDDFLSGGSGEDTLDGGNGNDVLRGGADADALIGGSGVDTATYTDSGAGVVVSLLTGMGAGGTAQGDTLDGIENLTGSAHGDTLTGNNASNVLRGMAGNDHLIGGGAADQLYGGTGADHFIFKAASDSLAMGGEDEIHDFSQLEGDKIDLSAIDGDGNAINGDQPLTYFGVGTLDGTVGQVVWNAGYLEGDTNGDGIADFRVKLDIIPNAADFIL